MERYGGTAEQDERRRKRRGCGLNLRTLFAPALILLSKLLLSQNSLGAFAEERGSGDVMQLFDNAPDEACVDNLSQDAFGRSDVTVFEKFRCYLCSPVMI